MKRVSVFFTMLLMLVTTAVMAQKQTTSTFKVSGNCEMCKSKIEKAAKAAGATKAEWSEETHVMEVSFDGKKTSADKIQQKIAGVGYDTEKYKALATAYDKLPGCCKYDREEKTKE